MSADKYPCIFSRQMEAIVYLYIPGVVNSQRKLSSESLTMYLRVRVGSRAEKPNKDDKQRERPNE